MKTKAKKKKYIPAVLSKNRVNGSALAFVASDRKPTLSERVSNLENRLQLAADLIYEQQEKIGYFTAFMERTSKDLINVDNQFEEIRSELRSIWGT